jgi:pimeloyl-ACP methyl ester carboxylesterase
VVPSLPGYGFSGKPATGWDVPRIARAWVEVMRRLGYDRFIAAGSDWGTSVSTSIALQQPERLLGLHLVPPLVPGVPADGTALTGRELAALVELQGRSRTASAYSAVQQTRPQTIGYSLVDSPVGLCAWILEKV